MKMAWFGQWRCDAATTAVCQGPYHKEPHCRKQHGVDNYFGSECGFFSQRERWSRSSREPKVRLQKGQGRNMRGRPPERPATRLCAALIHSSESGLLQCGHCSDGADFDPV